MNTIDSDRDELASGHGDSRTRARRVVATPSAGYRAPNPCDTLRAFDSAKPSAARVHDFYLGGDLNQPIDRKFARTTTEIFPVMADLAGDQRDFRRVAIEFMAARGVRQFLDLGCGVPTAGNTVEIVQRAGLDARVLCVDIDETAFELTETILRTDYQSDIICADIADPQSVTRDHYARAVLNTSQPIGILMVAVAHFLGPDQDPGNIVAELARWAVPGSYVALSHMSAETVSPRQQAEMATLKAIYEPLSPLYFRNRAEILHWFDDLDLLSPAGWMPGDGDRRLVHVGDWLAPHRSGAYECAWGAIARVPHPSELTLR